MLADGDLLCSFCHCVTKSLIDGIENNGKNSPLSSIASLDINGCYPFLIAGRSTSLHIQASSKIVQHVLDDAVLETSPRKCQQMCPADGSA